MPISFDTTVTHDLETAAGKEWIEANGLGGWASSTVAGCHTRRYHGLLVAATRPPIGRMVLLSKLRGNADRRRPGVRAGHESLRRHRAPARPSSCCTSFTLDPMPMFVYEAGGVTLRKTVVAIHGENTTVVLYEVLDAPAAGHPRAAAAHRLSGTTTRFSTPTTRSVSPTHRSRTACSGPRPTTARPSCSFRPRARRSRRSPTGTTGSSTRKRSRAGSTRTRTCSVTACSAASWRKGERLGVIVSTGEVAGRDPFALVAAERARRAKIARLARGQGRGRPNAGGCGRRVRRAARRGSAHRHRRLPMVHAIGDATR